MLIHGMRSLAHSLIIGTKEMTLKEQTLLLVTEDRIRTAYPTKRLNSLGLVYYVTSKVAWDVLERAFEAALLKVKRRAAEC
jgi:hypothetical protein